MIRYRSLPVSQVPDELWKKWAELLEATPEVDVPFLRPEFTRVVGSVRSDVELAVIERDDEPVGFFPFQREGNQAHAVVGRLSECHGAVVEPGLEWDPLAMFRACEIRGWHFDHLPEAQQEFSKFAWGTKPSPYMDLSEGYAAYRAMQKKSGSSLSQIERKTRKLEREQGTLRFEWHTQDQVVLDRLAEWKSAQHRKTGVLEIFTRDWVRGLVHDMRGEHSAGFSAPMSALYAGDQLVAMHLGLSSRTNFHIWFPTYDVEFHRYSPGLILLLMLAEQAADRGVTRLEFGPGEESYKQQFKSGETQVAEGIVSPATLTASCRAFWYHTKRAIRTSPYRNYLEAPLNSTRRLRQWIAFR